MTEKERMAKCRPWLGEKVVVDTGDHYGLPSADCHYIDADGKCHKGEPPMAAWLASIPKEEVSGVAGCSL